MKITIRFLIDKARKMEKGRKTAMEYSCILYTTNEKMIGSSEKSIEIYFQMSPIDEEVT
jgi:hypothetical protein